MESFPSHTVSLGQECGCSLVGGFGRVPRVAAVPWGFAWGWGTRFRRGVCPRWPRLAGASAPPQGASAQGRLGDLTTR